MAKETTHHSVAIIGTGFGGIGAAIRLRRAGWTDLILLERGTAVGGVWRDNHYPGATCDVESHLYSFSFAPNPRWSHRYAPQAEIWEYLHRCADRHGILPRIRFGHDVGGLEWLDDRSVWRIDTSEGNCTADIVVAAPGTLAEPRIPDLPGLDGFSGLTFHTARWPAGLELEGKRVAVVGTGASAVQVVPTIQPHVERLVLFQRTPAWVVPRGDRALNGTLAQIPLVPWAARAGQYAAREFLGLTLRRPRLAGLTQGLAERHLKAQVADPGLRQRLTPAYRIGCKRILVSDDYYPALLRPNVELVTGPAVGVTTRGAMGPDGVEREVDVIVFGTGFEATEFPFARCVRGRAGRLLSDVWNASPRAHLGTTISGFPNLFYIQGPNTGLGHSSVILMIEAQVEHIVNALAYMRNHGIAVVEPRPEAQAAFVADVDRAMEGTVWMTGGCRSWYLDSTGRNSALWPGSVGSFRRRVAPFRPGEYRRSPATAGAQRGTRQAGPTVPTT